MAYKSGTPVQPGLLRMDFSPIARGGEAFGAGIGQGLAALGQGIGKAQEQKKQAKNAIAAAKPWLDAVKTMEGSLPPGILQQVDSMSQAIGNEDLPLSQRGAMAAQLVSMGQSLFGAGMQQQMAQMQPPEKPIDFGAIATLAKTSIDPDRGVFDPAAFYAKGAEAGLLDERSVKFFDEIADNLRGTGPQVEVQVGGQPDPALNDIFKERSAARSELVNQGMPAYVATKTMEELLDKIGEGGVITGGLAKTELAAKSWLNRVPGVNFEDVAATQAYAITAGTLVGQIIKQFGAGTGLSDTDRAYAERMAAGDISIDKPALKRIVKAAQLVIEGKVKSHNRSVDQVPFDSDWKRNYLKVNLDDESNFFGGFNLPSSELPNAIPEPSVDDDGYQDFLREATQG